MGEPNQIAAEKLVEIYKARDPWQGHLLIGYLQTNGVEAAFQGLPALPLEAGQMLETRDNVVGVYVLERDAPQARELVKEFLSSENTETASPEAPHLDKQKIAELRGALQEERKTFEFLGWAAVVFLAALTILWAVWPVWLKTEAPEPFYRWTGVVLLALAAIFAGNYTGRHMRK